jgi:hypothetical protein
MRRGDEEHADVKAWTDEIADRYGAPITLEMAFMFVPAKSVLQLIGRPEFSRMAASKGGAGFANTMA